MPVLLMGRPMGRRDRLLASRSTTAALHQLHVAPVLAVPRPPAPPPPPAASLPDHWRRKPPPPLCPARQLSELLRMERSLLDLQREHEVVSKEKDKGEGGVEGGREWRRGC